MNKKLIATAVAAAFAAPAAMADVTAYARINNALDVIDPDGGDTTSDIGNISSRIGFRADAELGNGLTAHGRYEFFTFTDREGDRPAVIDIATGDISAGPKTRGGINDTRIGTVGLSGDFGRVDVGNQWSAFYNIVGTHMSPTYSVGYVIYSSIGGGPFRASNTVKYANSWGPVSLELDTRFSRDTEPPQDVEVLGRDNGEDFLDGYGIGASIAATDTITIAAVFDTELFDVGDDDDRIGVAGNFAFHENHRVAVGWMNRDNGTVDRDTTTVYYHGNNGGANSWMIGYGTSEVGDSDPSQLVLGFYHNMGGGFRIYTENLFYDADADDGDFNRFLFGLRYDY